MNWHVVITKPSCETLVSSKLVAAGFEVFYPKFKRYYPKLKKEKVIPLFSKYIFVKFDAVNDYKTITYTRGVSKILSFLGTPSIVKDVIIENLKKYCDLESVVTPKYLQPKELKKGDKIKITSGVLEGVEGIVSGLYNNKKRIEILIDLIKITLKPETVKKLPTI